MRTKGDIQDIYPLTPMQEGMLFHALYDHTDTAYFEQASFRLKGEVDADTVQKILDVLFSRHDILRTAFVYQNRERPLQVVLRNRRVDFSYRDLVETREPLEKREAAIRQFKETDYHRPFDLTRDVLMRVTLFRVAPSEYELIWSHHHILMDGWCVGILIVEFLQIYRSIRENRPHRLPSAIPFRTYIEWLEKIDRQATREYWKAYLGNYESPAQIPGKKERPEGGYRKEMIPLTLAAQETTRLKALAETNRVTLNILIQTVWGIILARYNGKRDVVFGAVVSGRPGEIAGIESMLGLFINTVPVRIRFEETVRLGDLLSQVQEAALESERHHYCPLAEIQAESSLKQNLIDHIMVFENMPGARQLTGLARQELETGHETDLEIINTDSSSHTGYDFILKLLPLRQLQLRFDFNNRVFDRSSVAGMADQFGKILRKILDEGDVLIKELKLTSAGSLKESVLSQFNDDLDIL